MTEGNKSVDADVFDVNSNCANSKAPVPVPVFGGSKGQGLPYAPVGWPQPEDVWSWKVGNRKSAAGDYWRDRSLYPPIRLRKTGVRAFSSKLSVEEYVQKEFPGTDVKVFFSSFIWRVPCADDIAEKDRDEGCRAENKTCILQMKARNNLAAKPCDICCKEDGFCRDCCCILCCNTIDWTYEGYSFIRCEATLDGNYICRHVAHIDCALRSDMAGTGGETIGGAIGFDMEYYCRRCDNKTDLIPRVIKLIKTYESYNSQEDAANILKLGMRILSGSEQPRAKDLRTQIACILKELKDGVQLNKF